MADQEVYELFSEAVLSLKENSKYGPLIYLHISDW